MSSELVTCLMLTFEGREKWRELARECFEAQTYPHRELLIIHGPGRIGGKRNKGCSLAEGSIIIHWDDDDWSSPDRITDQVERLLRSGADITGYHEMLFISPEGERWMYRGAPGYAIGTSLCYRKSLWEQRRFEDVQVGEDNMFQKGLRVETVPAEHRLIATMHGGNTSPREVHTRSRGGNAPWVRV